MDNSKCMEYTVNVGGRLLDLSSPCVMGIVNVTPDSFYTSVKPGVASYEENVSRLVGRHLADGAAMIEQKKEETRKKRAERNKMKKAGKAAE